MNEIMVLEYARSSMPPKVGACIPLRGSDGLDKDIHIMGGSTVVGKLEGVERRIAGRTKMP